MYAYDFPVDQGSVLRGYELCATALRISHRYVVASNLVAGNYKKESIELGTVDTFFKIDHRNSMMRVPT